MRLIACSNIKSDVIANNVTGGYRLKNYRQDLLFLGRQMPDGRLFVPFTSFVEMYEPGEYELVYHYTRTQDEEDRNNV